MAEAGIGELLVRTTLSLGVVLAIVAFAYVVAKRRAGRNVTGVRTGSGRTPRRRNLPAPIEVVGRVGLTRSTTAVALRFGDRVVLVSAPEQGPSTLLTDMAAADWDELHTVREPLASGPPSANSVVGAPTPGFVEALRQATARHA